MFPLYTVATGNANKVIDLSAGATFVFNFKAKAGAAPASYDFTIEATDTFANYFDLTTSSPFGNVKKCAVGKHPKSEKLGSTGQAACCARIHSRYFTGGSPSGLRV